MHVKIDVVLVKHYARPLDALETLIWVADEAMMASVQLQHPKNDSLLHVLALGAPVKLLLLRGAAPH
jgi:hypothetical protein